MKYFFLSILFTTIIAYPCWAKVTPSAEVLTAFKQKFPTASHAVWGKENRTVFEVEFTMNGKNYSANFDSQGKWLETETESAYDNLPNEVKAAFKKQYPNIKIKEVAMIENNKDTTLYEIEIKVGIKPKDLMYKGNGTVVK